MSAAGHRTRLQTEVLAVFDRVVSVIEDTVETFVQMRHVITAVQVVVDENFPVAAERVCPALEPMKAGNTQRLELIDEIAEKFFERRDIARRWFDPGERPLLPNRDLNWEQTICGAIEVADIVEIRRAFQLAFERIRPAVIWTAHLRSIAGGLSHDGGRMMTTSIEEPSNLIVAAAHDHDRLAGNFGCDIVSGIL